MNIWVLLKESDDGHTKVHAAYETREALDARMVKIGERNPQYPLQHPSPDYWFIGPKEDEGFFGNRPVRFRAQEVELKS